MEGIFRTTLDGHFLEVNPALAKMYGYTTPAELMDANRDLSRDFYVEVGRRQKFVDFLLQDGFISDFESKVFRSDWSTIWISEFARIVRGPAGEPLYFEGSVIDITDRKGVEVALQRSEAKFRHLIEKTDVVPWEADLESGRFTYVGPQAERFLGYPLHAWMEEGFLEEHVHPEDRVWMGIVRDEAIEHRHNFECEYRMLRADQRIIWIREIVSFLPVDENRISLGGFFLDFTQRREAEEQLKESRHFIEQVASASPTILYLYDPETRQTVYVNGRVSDILGYEIGELSEMNPSFILSLAHPDELEAHEKHLRQLARGRVNGVLEREFRLSHRSGHWVWVHSRECVFKEEDGGRISKMIGAIEDVTWHRQAVDKLAANEALFRSLAETTRVIPFTFDPKENRFTYLGPQAEILIGHPLRRWYEAESWTSIIHPSDVEEGTRFARESLRSRTGDFQTEFRLVAPGGNILWFRQIVHFAADDELGQVRGFFLDVTEAKAVEEENERSRQQLRELAAKNQLVREEERASVAREIHDELGQALTMFKMDVSWLSTHFVKSVPEEVIGPLEEKLRSMDQLMDRTLQTVRRILADLRPPLLDELGLGEAIEWQVQDFAKRVGIRYDLDVSAIDPLPEVIGTALFRVLQEILTNCARHSKASRIKVMLKQAEGNVILRVEDNGCGISEEKLRSSTTFGLLGMRERAWMFGGKLEISGLPGVGTTVALSVPLLAFRNHAH
ncbi:MAG: PAS domain-containing protein [Bryobacteraceae bacterium]|nr:PAS domain-containing protein [Bryobacteraceae bacterium]